MKVLSLVDRNTGAARSYVLDTVTLNEVAPILDANISREAHLMTDEHRVYRGIGWNFATHSAVGHTKGQYAVPGHPELHTNTIEGYFSIFKRGMKGIYQHCQEKHLHRYLAEFDFRYTNRQALGCNDADRADALLKGIVGKRLTYQTAGRGA